MTMRIIVVGVISAVTLGGCGNSDTVVDGATTSVGSTAPSAVSSPTSVDAQHDRIQPAAAVADGGEIQLLTHCGINGIMIAGRWWQAEPPLNDGQGNPPNGWGNPYQPGYSDWSTRKLRYSTQGGHPATPRHCHR